MKTKSNIKLNLSTSERSNLRQHKVKISEILDYAADEIQVLLKVSEMRAKEIYALADFQRVSSVGIRFAEDLVFLGYYSMAELSDQEGATLTDQYEKKKGYKTDPCVEDQFRLITYAAKTNDYSKNWWEFTAERKAYRNQFGYPKDRPKLNWTEAINPSTNSEQR